MRKVTAFVLGVTFLAASVFAESKIVPPIGITEGVADGRFVNEDGVGDSLTGSHDYSLATLIAKAATADTHVVNRIFGDGRFGQLGVPNTWLGINTFSDKLRFSDGTLSLPGLTPTSLTTTGWSVSGGAMRLSIGGVESIIYATGNISIKKDLLLTKALTVNGNSIFGNSGIDSATFNGRNVFFPNLAVHTYAGTLTNNYDGATSFDATGQTVTSLGTWDFSGAILQVNAALGSVLFAGASGEILGDNAGLFFDDPLNRLGIGTATPGFTLDVNGDVGFDGLLRSSNTNSMSFFTSSTIERARIDIGQNAFRLLTGALSFDATQPSKTTPAFTVNLDADSGFFCDGSDNCGITTAGVVALEATPTGEVGIGGMATPDELLHTAKAVDGAAVVFLVENSQANSAASTNETAEIQWGFGGINGVAGILVGKEQDYTSSANEDSFMAFSVDLDGTKMERARIDSAGNFGINTKTPDSLLDIEGGAITISEVAAPATPATNRVTIYAKAGGGVFSKDDTGAEFDLTAGGGARSAPFDWDNSSGGSATIEVTTGDTIAFEFVDNSTNTILGADEIPFGIDLTVNPTLEIHFTVTTTGAGNADVVFTADVKYIAVGELATKADDENLSQTVAVVDTLDRLHSFTFTLDASKMAASDRISVALSRVGGDGADTFSGRVAMMKRSRFSFN